jgi:hypothetical protein
MKKQVLTVVIADYSEFICAQEPVQHRTVRIELTNEQQDQLQMRQTGTSCGNPIFERVSMVFLEDE